MSSVLEFFSQPIRSYEHGLTISGAIPVELPANERDVHEVLEIDGEPIDIPPEHVRALGNTMLNMRTMIESGTRIRIDCTVFGLLMCGGEVFPDVYAAMQFPYRQTNTYSEVVDLDNAKDVPRALEPTILGDILPVRATPMLRPSHIAVRLSEQHDLYAQKFEDGVIGITDLNSAAQFYRSSAVGSVLTSRLENASGDPMQSYEVPGIEKFVPHRVATDFIILR